MAPMAQLLEVGASAVEGSPEIAGKLEEVLNRLEENDLGLLAAIGRRQLAVLKGPGGSFIRAEADRWLTLQGVRHAERFCNAFAPGFVAT